MLLQQETTIVILRYFASQYLGRPRNRVFIVENSSLSPPCLMIASSIKLANASVQRDSR